MWDHVEYHAITFKIMQYHGIPSNTIQNHAIPCNATQKKCKVVEDSEEE